MLHEAVQAVALDRVVQQAKTLLQGRWSTVIRVEALQPAPAGAPPSPGLARGDPVSGNVSHRGTYSTL